MDWNLYVNKLVITLLPAASALLVALLALGTAYLKKLTNKVDNENARDTLAFAIDEARLLATDTVRAVNQTLVNDLKAAAEDGKLTEEEKIRALETAKTELYRSLSEGSLKTLEKAVDNLEDWLTMIIESAVAEEKSTKTKVDALANPFAVKKVEYR